jgi:hypothetical protein
MAISWKCIEPQAFRPEPGRNNKVLEGNLLTAADGDVSIA